MFEKPGKNFEKTSGNPEINYKTFLYFYFRSFYAYKVKYFKT